MKIVFATNNLNKLNEVQKIVPNNISLLSLKDIGCHEDIPETQNTIEGNAIQKAQYVKDNYGFDCFADDTGLEVNSLDGDPGVFSARYAGLQRNADDNMNKLLTELLYKTDRSAHFKTVIALQLNNQIKTFTGICEGEITLAKMGDGGFGYDPVFKPLGHDKTFAQMDLDLKNKIGHRGLAIHKLIYFLNTLQA